jgi:hypothetical protein
MEEMRRLIAKRDESAQHSRQRSMPERLTHSPTPSGRDMDAVAQTIDELTNDVERNLSHARSTQDTLMSEVDKVASEMREVSEACLWR